MKYLRRLVWFIALRLLGVLIVLGMLTVSFYFAMNATNIYIVIKDGMARRAQVVMMDVDASALDNYFFDTWLIRDEDLLAAQAGTDKYENSTVTGFDHRVTLNWVWCWPWDDTALATVTERIPAIDGKTSDPGGVPRWPSTKYSMILSRENNVWKIKNMAPEEKLDNP